MSLHSKPEVYMDEKPYRVGRMNGISCVNKTGSVAEVLGCDKR
jgi:hypothetical protein